MRRTTYSGASAHGRRPERALAVETPRSARTRRAVHARQAGGARARRRMQTMSNLDEAGTRQRASAARPGRRRSALLDEDLSPRRGPADPARLRGRPRAVRALGDGAGLRPAEGIAARASAPLHRRALVESERRRPEHLGAQARGAASAVRSQREHGQIAQNPAELVSTPRRGSHLPRVLSAREAARLLDGNPRGGRRWSCAIARCSSWPTRAGCAPRRSCRCAAPTWTTTPSSCGSRARGARRASCPSASRRWPRCAMYLERARSAAGAAADAPRRRRLSGRRCS